MTPRITPTTTVKDGNHIDEYWPGVVYSTWKFERLRIRRERNFTSPDCTKLRSVTWQVWIGGADTTVGFRVERRAPRTRNW